ncbi:MAG TPA: hypothetical protein VHA73_10140 [Acidimicrobiales bacterium]|nr:hypothetical protein [Acidimicrobiales bacterium]
MDLDQRLALDLIAHVAGVVLVEAGQHGVHHLAGVAAVDRLGARHQLSAGVLEQVVVDQILTGVAGPAIELEDDDVVDISLTGDAVQHGHHLRALVGAGAGVLVEVLLDDDGAQLLGPAFAGGSLGRQRITLGVAVTDGLLFGTDPQVGDRTLDAGLLRRGRSSGMTAGWPLLWTALLHDVVPRLPIY